MNVKIIILLLVIAAVGTAVFVININTEQSNVVVTPQKEDDSLLRKHADEQFRAGEFKPSPKKSW